MWNRDAAKETIYKGRLRKGTGPLIKDYDMPQCISICVPVPGGRAQKERGHDITCVFPCLLKQWH